MHDKGKARGSGLLTCLNETMRHGSIPTADKLQISSGALCNMLGGVCGDGDMM